MSGTSLRARNLVIEGVGESGLPVEIRNAVIAQDTAVGIRAQVAFKSRAGRDIEGFLPAKASQKSQPVGKAFLETQHERVVIGHAVRSGEGELSELRNRTPRIRIGYGGPRAVNGRVPIRRVKQMPATGALKRDPCDQALGQTLLESEVPLM